MSEALQPDVVAAREGVAEERVSYWSLVRGQFNKNGPAVVGLWCIVGLFALATAAPLIAFSQPFFVREAGVWSFPFAGALFNRLLFENGVDIFFNLLLVLAPAYAGLLWLWRRSEKGLTLARVSALIALHLVLTTVVVPKTFFGADNPFYREAPIVDWSERLEASRAEGLSVTALFPVRALHYRDPNPKDSVSGPSARYWLGTDPEGRDVFVRMLYGTRISLTIGVVAVSIYVLIGVVLGALAGFFGGWVDVVISRLVEVMIAIPSFFLILTLAALVQERSIFHVMVIIGITGWTGVARLVRAEFLQQREIEYAQAAKALGLPEWRIIFRHLLPNAMAPVLVSATFGVASAILTESGLSFLGLGDLSVPSWGQILNVGRIEGKLWLILTPGLAIFLVVSVFNLVGEGLRDALDPKLRT